MKKKLLSFIVMFCMCLCVLTGCNLFVQNDAKYYNQVLATIGDYEITMYDFLQYYNYSDASKNVEEGNLEKSYKEALKNMMDRKIVVDYMVSNKVVDFGAISFDEAYKNDILREVYESIQNRLNTIQDKIESESNDKVENPENEKEKEEDKLYVHEKQNEFKSSLRQILDGNQFEMGLIYDEFAPDMTDAGEFKQLGHDEKMKTEVWDRYIKELEVEARKIGEKDLTENSLFKHEKERLFDFYREQKVISVFTNKYKSEINIDLSIAVNQYIKDYNRDHALYGQNNNEEINAAHRKAYIETMSGSNQHNVRYHIDGIYTEVANILIPFSAVQEEQVKQWKIDHHIEDESLSKEEKEAKELEFEEYLNNKVSNEGIDVYFQEENADGELENKTVKVSYVIQEVLDGVNPNNGASVYEKADKFNKYLYKYSDRGDKKGGSVNADHGFYVPLNKELDGNNNLVEPFAKAARQLHEENPNGGNIKAVASEFGVHILFNLGEVRNIIDYNELKANGIPAKTLYETRNYGLNEKSILETYTEKIEYDDSNYAMTDLLSDAKHKMITDKVVWNTYYYRMEDLWK